MSISIVLAVVLAIVGLALISAGFKVVNQSQCVVIERLGRYNTTLKSGFNVIIPFFDRARAIYWAQEGILSMVDNIDLRETVLDVPEQAVITRDNVSIHIDALLYLQITDPVKAAYEISNLPVAVAQLAQTSLRNVIGEMDLDQTLASRDVINAKLKAILDDATDKWGTKVNRVEIKNINPPREIQSAMEKQMQAERERRAKVLEAEGDKQARIARSEGIKQEQINLSEGQKEAAIRHAQGEANAIKEVAEATRQAILMVKEAVGNNADLAARYMITTSYLEKFGNFTAQPGDKVFIPYEATAALGGLGLVKELLQSSQKT